MHLVELRIYHTLDATEHFNNPHRLAYCLDGLVLNPAISFEYRKHSPDGFMHGYTGSGPSQLALAICLALWPAPAALNFYQEFKLEHVANLGHLPDSSNPHTNQDELTVLLDVSKYDELAQELTRANRI